MTASTDAQIEVVRALVAAQADPNMCDARGHTAICHAKSTIMRRLPGADAVLALLKRSGARA